MTQSAPPQTTAPPIGLQYRDRALLIGQTRSGKSTLAKHLLLRFLSDMRAEMHKGWSHPRILVVDTKPRWRGTLTPSGQSTQRLYRKMVPGDTLPAMLLSDMRNWDLCWDRELNPSGIVIAQNLKLDEGPLVRFQVSAITQFFESQFYKEPSLVYIDEGHDFFGANATARYGTAIQRCFRAGAEKGMASCLGVQRPKTVNLQTLTESNVLYLFHIKFREDLKRLGEMGLPPLSDSPPANSHRFLFFRDDHLYPKPLRLGLTQ
jgi:hypothetical protein